MDATNSVTPSNFACNEVCSTSHFNKTILSLPPPNPSSAVNSTVTQFSYPCSIESVCQHESVIVPSFHTGDDP